MARKKKEREGGGEGEALVPLPAEGAGASLDVPSEDLVYYATKSRADSTRRNYQGDWRRFVAWCQERGAESLPASPITVASYLIYFARDRRYSGNRSHSVRYIQRAMSAIGWAHIVAGYTPPPTKHAQVENVMRGVIRVHGKPPDKREALTVDDLVTILARCPDSMAGKRDRALLSLGFFGAFRRSELVALDRRDVTTIPGGFRVLLRHSKTDQTGEGERKGIKRRDDDADPVGLLRAWMTAADIQEGPLFRAVSKSDRALPRRLSDRAVAIIVKRACERAGIRSERYSGHSLRRGFATEAARGGADGLLIRKTTKHKSDRMVNEYVEEGTLLGRHAQDYIKPRKPED